MWIYHMYHIYLFNTIHCFRYDVEILKCDEMRLRLGPCLCWCALLCNKMKLLDMPTINIISLCGAFVFKCVSKILKGIHSIYFI